MAEVAEVEMTYAYGNFLKTKTGQTFFVLVQTRDKYGNFLTSSDETITFESCSKFDDVGECSDSSCR